MPRIILFFLIVLFYLGVNYKVNSPAVLGGDAGDIVFSYYYGGIPHPPGYPLNTMMGWLISRLPIGDTFAFRANFVSAVFSAFSLLIFYLILERLTKNRIITLAACYVLGFISLFWLYSHIAEVFPLLVLLVLISLYFLFRWEADFKEKNRNDKYLFFSIFFYGLAVFHHHTALLLAPAIFYLVLKSRLFSKLNYKKFAFLTGFFLAGFLPYVFIPLTALRKTPDNWVNPLVPGDFIRLITRADYGTFSASYDLIGISLLARLSQFVWYFKVIKNDFTFTGLFLVFTGIVYLFRTQRKYFWFFLLAVFTTGPFFLFYASFPPVTSFGQGVAERFLLLNYVLLAMLIGFGFLALYSFSVLMLSRFKFKKLVSTICLFSFLLFPMSLYFINLPKVDLSKSVEGDQIAKDILNGVDPPGMIFLAGDTITFNVRYMYLVNKVGNDSIIIPPSKLRFYSFRHEFKENHPQLTFPASFNSTKLISDSFVITGLAVLNYPKQPIYSLTEYPFGEDFVWVNEGMLKRLYKKDDVPNDQEIRNKIVSNLDRIEFDENLSLNRYVNFFTDEIIDTYGEIFSLNANELLKRNFLDDAEKYYLRSLRINAENTQSLSGISKVYSKRGKCELGISYSKKLVAVNPKSDAGYLSLADVNKDCFKDSAKSEEYQEKAKEIQKEQDKALLKKL